MSDLLEKTLYEQINYAVLHNEYSVIPLVTAAYKKDFFTPEIYHTWFISLIGKNTFSHQFPLLLQKKDIFYISDLDSIINQQVQSISFGNMDADKKGYIYSFFHHIMQNAIILDDNSISIVSKLGALNTIEIMDKNRENIAKRLDTDLPQKNNYKSIKL